MNRNLILLTLLGAVTFAVAYLILSSGRDERLVDRRDGAHDFSRDSGRVPDLSRKNRPGSANPDSAAGKSDSETGTEATAPVGSATIRARIEDHRGEKLDAFGFDLRPLGGQTTSNSQGLLEISNIPPGRYQLSIWADGHTQVSRLIDLEHEDVAKPVIRLKRGIRPAGRIIDEKSKIGVENALIRFHGGGLCKSGQDGSFEAPHDFPPDCLHEITVSHPEYDTYTYTRQEIRDTRKILLALTRGNNEVTVTISNRSKRPLPEWYRLRFWRHRGGNIPPEVRKEITIRPTDRHLVKGLHHGTYDVLLEFPGTGMAARRRRLTMRYNEQRTLEFAFDSGATLEGRLKSRGGSLRGVKIDVWDETNLLVAATHADKDDRFKIEGLEPGTYRLRVWAGTPTIDLQGLVVGESNLSVVGDIDERKLTLK